MKKTILQTSLICTLQTVFLSFTSLVLAGNIDPNEDDSRYAYEENIEWVHFHSTFVVGRDDWQLKQVKYTVKTSWTPEP